MTRWSIIVIGVITALQRFFDVTAFLAGLGIIGITVGFAMQEIMQNFVAGVILLVQQPFEVEDVIETDQFTGNHSGDQPAHHRNEDSSMAVLSSFPTQKSLRTQSSITRALIFRRVELNVGVSYDADPAEARQAVMDAIPNVPGFVGEPEPMVVFHTFGGSSIDLSAYFWINMSKSNPMLAKDAAIELVKSALDKKGIEIPFPITTVIRN